MINNTIPIITIDGQSGVGKSTISKILANILGWHSLNSGIIYRILALIVDRYNVSLDDIQLLTKISENLNFLFKYDININTQKIILNNEEDITVTIKEEKYANMASILASYKLIRLSLIRYQHAFLKKPGLIAEGRDMGTVIFPKARNKFFITADIKERGNRRLLQLKDKGIDANLDIVVQDLIARDKRDEQRLVSPLKPDPDAIIIDTTKLSINDVLQQILGHVKNMSI